MLREREAVDEVSEFEEAVERILERSAEAIRRAEVLVAKRAERAGVIFIECVERKFDELFSDHPRKEESA